MAGVKRVSLPVAGRAAATVVRSHPVLKQSGFFFRPPHEARLVPAAWPPEALAPRCSPLRVPSALPAPSAPESATPATDRAAPIEAFCRHHQLSPKETRLLLLAIDGHNNDEIAELLACSRPTVATHWNRIFAKTAQRGQRDVVCAVVRWITEIGADRKLEAQQSTAKRIEQ